MSPAPLALRWRCEPFAELSPARLYAILDLRLRVFVVEQRCAFRDTDGKDARAWHLQGLDEQGRLLAYARLLPRGASFREASVGRIITAPEARGVGLGKALVAESLERLATLFGPGPVRIGAQQHLERFYAGFGFARASEVYDEDGIAHIQMLRAAPTRAPGGPAPGAT